MAMSIRCVGRLPRAPWAADVLAEQLVTELPEASSLQRLARRLRETSSSSLLLDMAKCHFVSVVGTGVRASYTLAKDYVPTVERLETALTSEERNAIERAAQRSKAIFAAWANASATWASSPVCDTAVARARRQAVR